MDKIGETSKNIEESVNKQVVTETAETSMNKIDEPSKNIEVEHLQINEYVKLLNSNKLLACELEKQQELIPNIKCKLEFGCQKVVSIKPYTEDQLATLYTNSELQMIDDFTLQYVEAELKGLAVKHHTLYELLTNYVQVRAKIIGNTMELEQLRKEYCDLQGMLWTTDTAIVTGRGECLDGTTVTTTHSFQKATFHRSVFQSITRILGLIRKLTYENYTLYSYTAEDLRLQVC